PNTADYNQVTGTSGGAGSLAGETVGTPDIGLSFVEGGATLREIEASSYSWGAANPAGSTPSLQDLTLALAPGSVEPGRSSRLAPGSRPTRPTTTEPRVGASAPAACGGPPWPPRHQSA